MRSDVVTTVDPVQDLITATYEAESRRVLATLTAELDAATSALEASAPARRPKGLGGLTYAVKRKTWADVKQQGYFVFAPARLPGGQIVVVNRGYVPVDRKAEPPAGPVDITGYLRWPETPGWFVSERGTDGDIWFVRDPAAMATYRGWGPVAPFYIDQESPVPPQGFPKPGPLAVKLRNDHLGYAVTWFGLAASLAAVFLAWALRERYNRTT